MFDKFNSNKNRPFTDVKEAKPADISKAIQTSILADGFFKLSQACSEIESAEILIFLDRMTEGKTYYVDQFSNFKNQAILQKTTAEVLKKDYDELDAKFIKSVSERLQLERDFDRYKKQAPQKVEVHTLGDIGVKYKNLAKYRGIIASVLLLFIPVAYYYGYLYGLGLTIFALIIVVGPTWKAIYPKGIANAKTSTNIASKLIKEQRARAARDEELKEQKELEKAKKLIELAKLKQK